MRSGRDGTGERLPIDVTEVAQRQPALGQFGVEAVQRHAGSDGDQTRGSVGGNQIGEPVESDLDTVGQPDRGERVA